MGLGLLATVLASFALSTSPAQAADSNPDLTVRIDSLSPTVLKAGKTVTMSGTVTNKDGHAWGNVQAYLVIPASPFTTRAQIEEAIENGAAYTGARVTDVGLFDIMGDLAPGQTRSFRVRVPHAALRVSGADGVYPVGVQILGTDTDGTRSTEAIARATTFLPQISSSQRPVPASAVWPFLMPDFRGAGGNYDDANGLLAAISTGGQLRNLLDLAVSTPRRSSTVLVDPALLVGVDDLANQRHLDDEVDLTVTQAAEARQFLQDLLTLARRESCWVLAFDRPDVLALATNPDLSGRLSDAIDQATETTLTTYQLSGRMVSWPTREGVTSGLLRSLRGNGDNPVIVTPGSLPGWDRRQGSLIQYGTPRGPVPLLVNDVLDAGVPGRSSAVTLRQRILSQAALAVLQRAIDPQSRADAVTMVDPTWNPGRTSAGQLSGAFDSPFTTGASLDDLLTRQLITYDGAVPSSSKAKPLGRAQLQAASAVIVKGETLSSVMPRIAGVDAALARDVAGLLGVRWRRDPETAIAIARSRARQAGADLTKITVKGPPSVTLSSSAGGFPLTITNGTDEDIRIGVTLDSSNPALRVPSVKPVEIGAGERRTLTVKVDLGAQKTTYLTARLSSPDGETIGEPDEFSVRSSRVGVVLWVAMGVAGLLVLVALVRRFRRHSTRVSSERLPDDE